MKAKVELLKLLEQKRYIETGNLFYRWFGTTASRKGYLKHLQFLADGIKYRMRAFLAGNRVGKSQTGAFEVACHATGLYPDWWEGKRFEEATTGWVVGKTSETVRDTVQVALLGQPADWGTGMLPREKLVHITKSAGGRADIVTIKHVSGGVSTIGFKTNDSGRQSFEGTARDYIWIDEECDREIWFECLMRTVTTNGIIFTTFTPLRGLTELILSLVKDGNLDTPVQDVSVTTCGWDDAPHLTDEVKKEMLALLPPHQRLARSAGVPQLGAGAIYPIDPSEYTIAPFEIPKHYLRLGAMDVGWKITAACWLAIDPESGTVYIYSEHYRGEAEPVVHAEAIKSRGKIPLVIDSAAHGRSQHDGNNLYQMYEDLGLDISNANKSVETGIYEVWTLFSAGKLKIFQNCSNLLSELKTYHRNEKGVIIKSNDHLCDCLRYGIMTRDKAITMIPKIVDPSAYHSVAGFNRTSL